MYIDVIGGRHLSKISYPDALLNPFVSCSVKRTSSAIDIFASAERRNFTNINLDPLAASVTVAEPAPLANLALSLLATITFRRRKSQAT